MEDGFNSDWRYCVLRSVSFSHRGGVLRVGLSVGHLHLPVGHRLLLRRVAPSAPATHAPAAATLVAGGADRDEAAVALHVADVDADRLEGRVALVAVLRREGCGVGRGHAGLNHVLQEEEMGDDN